MAFWDFFRKRPAGKPPEPAPAPTPEPAPNPRAFLPAPAAPAPAPIKHEPNDFLPISRDELLAKAIEVRRTTGWMFFGRRDLIPPAEDPRTRLIDRGMVAEGYFTPEQLAEMHRVGDEHARHANRLEQIQVEAGKTAEQVVAADRAARAAVKARKKAEAAARREQRAAEIATRRATDIIFVGRGVSSLLNQRDSDAGLLEAKSLPFMASPADLAKALDLPIGQLRWLCFHTEVATRIHYVQFEIPKKSGGVRTLSAPHRKLAAAQQWILENILAKLPTEEPAHGFVPGRSTVTNALPHAGRDVVVNVDLEAFFPSIRFGRVRALFRRTGYSGAVSTLLALLCTECPRKKVIYDGADYFVATGPRGLPQGACTSPALSNQIARRLDRRLSALSAKLEFNYTRYADDLTFSADPGRREKVGYLLARIRHICGDEGFQLNQKKTRVQRPDTRQTVTGLVVNVRPSVPRDLTRRIRAILHRAKTEGLEAQNREHLPHFRAWLEGMINYIAMVNPKTGETFREALRAL